MSAFLFSDLHASYKQLDNLRLFLKAHDEIDCLISAGDFVNMGEPVGFANLVIEMLDDFKRPFFWVPGNNDFGRAYYKLQAKYPSLEGKVVVISTPCEARAEKSSDNRKISPSSSRSRDDRVGLVGRDDNQYSIKLTGVGGSPASWAGQYAGAGMIDRKAIANSIFISHVPPPGVFNWLREDPVSPVSGVISSHHEPAVGRIERGEKSYQIGTKRRFSDSPRAHICGHIHQTWGVAYLGSTKIVKLAPLERGFYAIMDLETLAVDFKRF